MSRFSVAVILLVITAAIAFFVIVPRWQAVQEARSTVAELQTFHDQLVALAARRDELTRQYNQIPEDDLTRLHAMVPAGRDTAAFLVDLEAIAQHAAVSIDQVDFASADKSTGALPKSEARDYAVIPVGLSLHGSYENFRAFLNELERDQRLTDVGEINFSAAAAGQSSPAVLRGAIYYRK